MVHRFATPETIEQLERLVVPSPDPCHVPLGAEEFVLRPTAEPDAQDDSTPRQLVERREVTGELPGLPSSCRDDPGAQRERLGPCGDPGQGHDRVDQWLERVRPPRCRITLEPELVWRRRVDEHVPQEHTVPARRFGGDRVVDHHVRIVTRNRVREDQPMLHRLGMLIERR